MHKEIYKKMFVYGCIALMVGFSLFPTIMGSYNEKNKDISLKIGTSFVEETLTDWAEDVCIIDAYTGNISIVTENPYVEVDNIDIIAASCTQDEKDITVTLQVAGGIENRGGWIDPYNFSGILDVVEYDFQLTTSEQEYLISYFNETGFIEYGNETVNLTTSNFSVNGDTLCITFSLTHAEELCQDFTVMTYYVRADLSDPYLYNITFLFDMAPDPPLMKALFFGFIQNVIKRQDYIMFHSVRMKTVRFMPLNVSTSSNQLFVVSQAHIGYVGRRIIIGLFDVSSLFLLNTISYRVYQRFITKYYNQG